MDHEALAAILRRLADPAQYPSPPATVELVQTHISWVFLAGDDVYKLKKPVRFSFLDFSTLEARRHFCAEEVRLNRRLAPSVYLGVVGLFLEGSRLVFAAADDPRVVEVAVHMRRLPDDRLLPRLLEAGVCDAAMIEAIVDRLVEFHRHADGGPEVRAAASPEALGRQLELDFSEMDAFHGDTLAAADDARLRRFLRDWIATHVETLRGRQDEGRIRDGHGDLHAEHICIPVDATQPIVIFDCIEFRPEFRQRDVAGEIAFLSMDLEFRGHADWASHLVRTYAARAGDPELPQLVPFYACHRAYIRGKVASLKSREPEVGAAAQERARCEARRYFALALRYSWAYAPALVVVAGLSGSGKSTLARRLAERTGFVHLASDVIRKELAGLAATDRSGAGDEGGIYGAAFSARTYATMYGRAWDHLAAGRGVILDATFQRRQHRAAARKVADDTGVPCWFVECVCSEEESLRRLQRRAEANDDVSDAGVEVYRKQRDVYEAYSPDEGLQHLRIDTEAMTGAAALATIEATLHRTGT